MQLLCLLFDSEELDRSKSLSVSRIPFALSCSPCLRGSDDGSDVALPREGLDAVCSVGGSGVGRAGSEMK